MKTRRDMFGMLAAVPFLGAVLVPRKKAKVETLEHDPGPTQYITRWEFGSEEEAIDFVRDLIPELTYVKIREDVDTASVRSGYRGAVRAQFKSKEILETQWKIVSKKTGKTVLDKHIVLGSIGMTWTWLENIRVNGKVVTRPNKPDNPTSISEYLIQPFKKGNPVIEEVPKKNYCIRCSQEIAGYATYCQRCYLEKEAAYAEYDIKHNPEFMKHNKNFTLERVLALAEYRQNG